MIAATGVSRTVVREAVAALRADGLVVTRQGVGAFVADHVRRPFRIDFDEHSPLREVLNVMELRTGVEIEAAGLAAERATPAQTEEDRRALRRDRGGDRPRRDRAVDQDFAFHCAIADATGNPQFRRFLEYLGRFVIPRQHGLGPLAAGDAARPARHVPEGARADPDTRSATAPSTQARDAMRATSATAAQRYQKLAAELGIE